MGRQPGTKCPSDLQLVCRLKGLPRLLCDHADKIFLDDYLHNAWNAPNGSVLDADERCADGRRPHNLAVHHAGYAHVVDELELTGDHCRDLLARHRLSKDRPFTRMFSFGGRVERNAECPTSDQFGIGDALGGVCLRADHTVFHA